MKWQSAGAGPRPPCQDSSVSTCSSLVQVLVVLSVFCHLAWQKRCPKPCLGWWGPRVWGSSWPQASCSLHARAPSLGCDGCFGASVLGAVAGCPSKQAVQYRSCDTRISRALFHFALSSLHEGRNCSPGRGGGEMAAPGSRDRGGGRGPPQPPLPGGRPAPSRPGQPWREGR